VHVLVEHERLHGLADGRRVTHEIAERSQVLEVPHAARGEPAVRIRGLARRNLQQPAQRVVTDAAVGCIERIARQPDVRQNARWIHAECAQECGQSRESAHALAPGSAGLSGSFAAAPFVSHVHAISL
jgi:hypothetical protein